MNRFELSVSVPRGGASAALQRLSEAGVIPDSPPEGLVVDDKSQDGPLARLSEAVDGGRAKWSGLRTLSYRAATSVLRYQAPSPPPIDLVGRTLTNMDFEYATGGYGYRAWGTRGVKYRGVGLGMNHFRLGWGCYFQGPGHQHLASRRALERGPWRKEQLPGDTTFVQFHELDADPKTALDQAKPGHQRMAGDAGVFISDRWHYEYKANLEGRQSLFDVRGFYDANARKLKVVAHGRPVSQQEMHEATAIRLYPPSETEPIDQVAYVFMTEDQARAHLHELWLRELECWAIVDGKEVRLDDSYEPPPYVLPDWVKRVQDREGR